MPGISLIRRKGDTQIYADVQDDAGRQAWYQPILPEAIQALGLSDKNIRYAGKVDNSLFKGSPLDADGIKKLAQEILAKGGNVGFGNLKSIVSGDFAGAFGTHETNYDPTTPEQEKNNAAVKGQMNDQYNAQQALETSVASQNKIQPPPGTAPPKSGSSISAAGFEAGKTPAPDGTDGSGFNADQLSNLVKVKLPNGAVITVPKNSNIAATYGVFNEDQSGADMAQGQSGTGASNGTGAGSNGGTNNGAQAPNGQSNGANAGASSLPPVYEQALKSLQNYIDTLAAQGKSVNPELKLSPETINQFMDQAKTELAPWHAQQIGQAQLDITNDLKFSAEEQTQERSAQDMMYQQQQEQAAAAAAERGIADSGIRNLAEARLGQQYKGLVESTRRRFDQQQRAIGLSGERLLGSANMPNLAGIPAVEGIAYKPQGGLTGGLESQQKQQIAGRAADLAGGKRTMDASLIV